MRGLRRYDSSPGEIGLGRAGGQQAFSIVEAVMSMAVAGIMMAGLVSGYRQAVRTAEWSAYSLAANSICLQGLERVRAAKWDPAGGVDQVQSSFFPDTVEVLDIPSSKTNIVYATNHCSLTTVSTTPGLRMIRVDCRWRFFDRGLYTNTAFTYRAPDQ
jgi:type II secretory pathway pseudopilin PulG